MGTRPAYYDSWLWKAVSQGGRPSCACTRVPHKQLLSCLVRLIFCQERAGLQIGWSNSMGNAKCSFYNTLPQGPGQAGVARSNHSGRGEGKGRKACWEMPKPHRIQCWCQSRPLLGLLPRPHERPLGPYATLVMPNAWRGRTVSATPSMTRGRFGGTLTSF